MPPINYVSPFEDPLGNIAQLIWPALATGYRYSAVATRMTRSPQATTSASHHSGSPM
jgi:peptide/nickel transport system permease protein